MISEETLTFYYYGDGLSATRHADVERELLVDPALANRYAKLCSELEQLSIGDDAPISDLLVHRLHKSIDLSMDLETTSANSLSAGAETLKPGGTHSLTNRFAALAATLILGLGIGVYFFESAPGQISGNLPVNGLVSNNVGLDRSADDASSPFLRGLQTHLRKTRFELDRSELQENVDSPDRYQALLAVAGQNRMYEKAAELNQAAGLARVLRAFEPTLMRLAKEDLTEEQERALIAKFAFELDVMLTKLSRVPSKGRYSL